MSRSVALLRGINVGPTTKVPMALLRTLFEAAGATDVTTLLNSGNVVFSGLIDADAVLARIRSDTGVPTHLLVIEGEDFRRTVEAFPPALAEAVGDESKLTISFMRTVPAVVDIPAGIEPELIDVGAEAVYQALPNGIANTKLRPAFWKQFPPETTARNLRTAKKLLELL